MTLKGFLSACPVHPAICTCIVQSQMYAHFEYGSKKKFLPLLPCLLSLGEIYWVSANTITERSTTPSLLVKCLDLTCVINSPGFVSVYPQHQISVLGNSKYNLTWSLL